MKIDLGHTDARKAQISSTVPGLRLKDSSVYGSTAVPPRKQREVLRESYSHKSLES